MLGFEVFVYRLDLVSDFEKAESRKSGLIARWMVNLFGLDWLHALVEQGKADFKPNGGYPERFVVQAKHVIPVLLAGLPESKCPPVIGEDYVQPANWVGRAELHYDHIVGCAPDQLLRIDAWDQS